VFVSANDRASERGSPSRSRGPIGNCPDGFRRVEPRVARAYAPATDMSSRRYAWTAGTSAIEAAATDWRIASRPEGLDATFCCVRRS
jgi:hypothetical protein